MWSWCWKAGGNKNTFNVDDVGYASAAAARLTGGSITPTGSSVGTKQGFSIIKYTLPGSTDDQSFPHGFGTKNQDFIIVKNLDRGYSWDIYHKDRLVIMRLIFNPSTVELSDHNTYWMCTIASEPTLILDRKHKNKFHTLPY